MVCLFVRSVVYVFTTKHEHCTHTHVSILSSSTIHRSFGILDILACERCNLVYCGGYCLWWWWWWRFSSISFYRRHHIYFLFHRSSQTKNCKTLLPSHSSIISVRRQISFYYERFNSFNISFVSFLLISMWAFENENENQIIKVIPILWSNVHNIWMDYNMRCRHCCEINT